MNANSRNLTSLACRHCRAPESRHNLARLLVWSFDVWLMTAPSELDLKKRGSVGRLSVGVSGFEGYGEIVSTLYSLALSPFGRTPVRWGAKFGQVSFLLSLVDKLSLINYHP